MNYLLTRQNLTCIFSQLNKRKIDEKAVKSIFPDEDPTTISIPDPHAPTVVKFNKQDLEIVFVENRLVINWPGKWSKQDSELIMKSVLRSCGNQELTAFGFNFNYEIKCPQVTDVFKIGKQYTSTPSFKHLEDSFIKLSYLKDTIIYSFDLKDATPARLGHINAHFNMAILTQELSVVVHDHYNKSLEESGLLLKEVLGNVTQ